MKTKIIKAVSVASLGFGIAFGAMAWTSPGDWEQQYCKENPRECYCVYQGGVRYCFIK